MASDTASPPADDVLLQSSSAGVLRLTLNRPQRKNALTFELVEKLGDALATLPQRQDVRVVVLSGTGGAFCSGADLTTIVNASGQDIPERIDQFHRLIHGIVQAPQPVIASVCGPAVGFGADLALACDVRIFGHSGYLEEGFVKVGLMPDGGGTYFVPQALGMKAFEVLALGERLDAGACERWGVANHVVEDAALDVKTEQLAARLCKSAPLALRQIKEALHEGAHAALHAALLRERTGQTQLVQSQDFQEGVAAFLEKRAPEFEGK